MEVTEFGIFIDVNAVQPEKASDVILVLLLIWQEDMVLFFAFRILEFAVVVFDDLWFCDILW